MTSNNNSNSTDDADADAENDDLVITTTEWSKGAFYLARQPLSLPKKATGVDICTTKLITCAGSQQGYSQRVVVFEQGALRAPKFDTSSWTDPSRDWVTINRNVTAIQTMNTGASFAPGEYGCNCSVQSLSFSQWMLSRLLNNGSSFFGIDNLAHYDLSNNNNNNNNNAAVPPDNWFQVSGDATNPHLTREYVGQPPLYKFSSGWTFNQVLGPQKGDAFFSAGDGTSFNSYSLYPNHTHPITLRIWSQTKAYAFRIDRVSMYQHAGQSDVMETTQTHSTEFYTHSIPNILIQTNSEYQATAYFLHPLPQGYYYSITILNDDEHAAISAPPSLSYSSSQERQGGGGNAAPATPPECKPNKYYGFTKHPLKVTTSTCNAIPCQGEKIQIGTPPPSSSGVSNRMIGTGVVESGGTTWMMATLLLWWMQR